MAKTNSITYRLHSFIYGGAKCGAWGFDLKFSFPTSIPLWKHFAHCKSKVWIAGIQNFRNTCSLAIGTKNPSLLIGLLTIKHTDMTVFLPENRKSRKLFSLNKNNSLLILLSCCSYANTGSLFLMTASTSSIVFSTHSAICSNV